MQRLRGIFQGHEKKRVMEKMFRSTVHVKGKALKITNFDLLLKVEGPDVVVVVGQLQGVHAEFTYETGASVVDTNINREIARTVAVKAFQAEAKERRIAFELAHTANVMTETEKVKTTKEAIDRASLIQQRINDGVKEALKK